MEGMTIHTVVQADDGKALMAMSASRHGAIPAASKDKQQNLLSAPPRILVVDDNTDARNSLALLLREHGYVTLTAPDGYSAIERATEFRPHAILLDIVMPGISGFKVAETLRKQPALADTLLITVTGMQQDIDSWLSKDAGCNFHLEKPIDFEMLNHLLQTNLSS